MDWLPVSVLTAVGLLLVASTAWIGRRERDRAGLFWSLAGLLLVVDGLVTITQMPEPLVPYLAYGGGPLIAWLAYKGAASFAGVRAHPAALPLALLSVLAWVGFYESGEPTFGYAAGSVGAAVLVFATYRTLSPIARTTAQRAFVRSWLIPGALIALDPIFKAAGLAPHAEVEIWMVFLAGIGLLAVLVLLERHNEEARQLALQNAEQLRLGALVGEMGTWTLDLESGSVEWSEELYHLHGLSPDEPLSEPLDMLYMVAAEDREPFRAALLELVRTGGELDFEYRSESTLGAPRFMRARARRMTRPNGRKVIVGTSADVTTHHSALEELRVYRTQLEDLVEQRTAELAVSQRKLLHTERLASIGTLAAGLAHQVNNPVGSILAAADFATRCEGDDDEIEIHRRAMNDIAAEAHRCGEIVRNMLRFASDRPTNKKVVPIDEILERTCQSMRRTKHAADAELDLHLEGPSPLVNVSGIEIEQALINLIENALQSRQNEVRVEIERRIEGDQVRILIRDNGRGIAQEDLDRVLDPFFTSRLEAGGTGLGLSVAHGIAREHRGDLTIESDCGVGTTTTLSLPVVRTLD